MNESCVGCHGGGISPDLRADKSYNSLVNGGFVDTVNAESSKLIEKINSGHGTSGNLSAQDKLYLLTWIKEGAKDN